MLVVTLGGSCYVTFSDMREPTVHTLLTRLHCTSLGLSPVFPVHVHLTLHACFVRQIPHFSNVSFALRLGLLYITQRMNLAEMRGVRLCWTGSTTVASDARFANKLTKLCFVKGMNE